VEIKQRTESRKRGPLVVGYKKYEQPYHEVFIPNSRSTPEIMGSLGYLDDDLMAASCKVLLAGTLSKKFLSEVQEGVQKLQRAPLLVGFLSSTDPPARTYAEWTAKTAREK
jgi:hypothetical protein